MKENEQYIVMFSNSIIRRTSDWSRMSETIRRSLDLGLNVINLCIGPAHPVGSKLRAITDLDPISADYSGLEKRALAFYSDAKETAMRKAAEDFPYEWVIDAMHADGRTEGHWVDKNGAKVDKMTVLRELLDVRAKELYQEMARRNGGENVQG